MAVAALCATAVAFAPQNAPRSRGNALAGWLDNFLPKPLTPEEFEADRRERWPEQYAAVLDEVAAPLAGDEGVALRVRPLLARTQLEARPLRVAYDAARDGWSPAAFHGAVDASGAAVVYARTTRGLELGGYNPKGWASMGNARPSPAAFLFAFDRGEGEPMPATKLRSASHIGCNSVAFDAPTKGIDFGVEAFAVPLREDEPRRARSKLGVYYEKRPDGGETLWTGGASSVELDELLVLVGVYPEGHDIEYSGAVMDMTSG